MADDMNIQAVLSADASGMVRGFNSATASAQQLQAKLNPLNRSLSIAGGVIGGAGFAMYKMGRQAFDAAARVSEMRVAIGAIGKASGLGEKAIMDTAKAIRKQGIEMAAAQKIAITYAQNNLNMADAAKVARVGQDLAVISQRNSTDTAELLTRAIQTGNSQLLKSAGISRMAGEAYDEYGKKLGKSSTSLSALERQQAITNLILSEGAKVAGIYEAAMTEPGKVLRSFPRLVNDMQVALGQSLLDGFGPAIKVFYDFTKAISQAVSEGGAFHPMVQVMSGVMTQLLEPLVNGISAMTNFVKSLSLSQSGVASATASVSKFLPVLAAMGTGLSVLAGKNILSMIPVIGKYASVFNPWVGAITVLVALSPRLRESFMRIVKAFLPLLPAVKNTAIAFTKMAEKIVETIADVVDVLVGPLTVAVSILSAGIYLLTSAFGSLEPVIYLIGSAMLISFVKGAVAGNQAIKTLVFNLHFMGLQLKETAMRLKSNFAFGLQQTGSALKAFSATGIAAFKAVGLAAKAMAVSLMEVLLPLIAIFAVIKVVQMLGAASKQTKERTNDLNDALKENVEALKGNKEATLQYLASLDGVAKQLTMTGKDGDKLTSALNTMGVSATDFADKLTLLKGAQDRGGVARVAYYKSLLLAQGVEASQAQLIADQVHSQEALRDVLWNVKEEYKGYATALEEIDDQAEKTSIQDLVTARLSQISALGKEQAAYASDVAEKVRAQAATEGLTNETIVAQRVLVELNASYVKFIAKQKEKTAEDLKSTQVVGTTAVAMQTLIGKLEALTLAEGDAKFKTEELATALFGVAQIEFNKNAKSVLEMRKEMTALHDEVRANKGNFDSLTGSALQLADNIAKNATEMKNMGKSSADIAAMQSVLASKFLEVAKNAGFQKGAVEKLMTALGLLQNIRTVAIVDLDMTAAVNKLELLRKGLSMFSGESGYVQGQLMGNLQKLIADLKKEKTALVSAGKTFTETTKTDKGAETASRMKGLRDEITKTYEGALAKATERIKNAKDAQESFAKSIKDSIQDMASLGQAFAAVEENSAKVKESHDRLSSSVSEAMLSVSAFTGIIEGQTAAQEALKQSLLGQSDAQSLVNNLQAEQGRLLAQYGRAKTREDQLKIYDDLARNTEALTKAQEKLALSDTAVADAQKESDKAGKSFIEGLRLKVQAAKDFGQKLQQLKSLGLNENALSQVIGAGAVAGGAMADELIKGAADGLGTIGETNKLVNEASELAKTIGVGIADSFYDIGTTSGQATIDAFKAQAEKAVEFAERIKTLVAMGLNETSLQQVLAAGVTAGTKLADSLIAGGKDAIAQTNAIQTALENAAGSASQAAAKKYYDAGIAFAQAIYDGLDAKWKELKPKIDKMTEPELKKVLDQAVIDANKVTQPGPDIKTPIMDTTYTAPVLTLPPDLVITLPPDFVFTLPPDIADQISRDIGGLAGFSGPAFSNPAPPPVVVAPAVMPDFANFDWSGIDFGDMFAGISVGGLATFATGGIVNKPTIGLVGEGGESEAIIPLSKLGDMVGGKGETNIYLTVTAGMGTNGAQVGQEIVNELIAWQRRNGALPVRVQ
jgi:hypothetical protein